jgi:MFS transporter, PHS family, inorganic phosphate transporter
VWPALQPEQLALALQDNPDLIVDAAGADVDGGHDTVDGIRDTDATDKAAKLKGEKVDSKFSTDSDESGMAVALGFKAVGKKAHNEFFAYFSEWRHLKIRIGTCMTWFLVDIAFYGINLNQSFILTAIEFTAKRKYRKLHKTAAGSAQPHAADILAACHAIPRDTQ